MAQNDKEGLLARFHANPPADASAIQEFENASGLLLPEEYALFMRQSNGGEGVIGSAYVIFWRVEDLLEMNKAYMVAEYAPGLLLFGSDGGGEAFAFDTRSVEKPIVSVPFVGMDLRLARPVASTFSAFLRRLSSCKQ